MERQTLVGKFGNFLMDEQLASMLVGLETKETQSHVADRQTNILDKSLIDKQLGSMIP